MFNIILKEYRHIKCLSQEELSYQLEVNTNHIRNIELGKIYPSEKLIQKIIKCIAANSELLTKPISSETLGCLFLPCQSRSLTDNNQALIYGQMQSILDCLQKNSQTTNCTKAKQLLIPHILTWQNKRSQSQAIPICLI